MKNLKLYRMPIAEFVNLCNNIGPKLTVVTVEQERVIGNSKYEIPNFYLLYERNRELLEKIMHEAQAECGFDFYAISQKSYLVMQALEEITLCKLGKDEEFAESVLDFNFNQTIYYDQLLLDNAYRVFATKLFESGEELTELGDQYLQKSVAVMQLKKEIKSRT